ncbi:pyridoxamine 5'-phosphate oxidase family protein [Natrarchaeobius oligotrophus]|uniref:Pyridoxamine 5'-phosphate oxidase family protein n=1 Tax=Natrarchaeobius chitinivorans TaxID=1679083 RepID=A0A3N6NGG9_NATCH|nr:pyridoxamine 5'-phosphate oxidase family protein [Natrarchaeobius chitinivorans]RQG98122.1 pyridoxamine 5'-phosphate oxidase family protein [Natrarchaeobius chitinivorans]
MPEFLGSWNETEVEAFLQRATIPIRIATHRPDGSPWVVTVWYRYHDGGFECATEDSAHLVRFLRTDPEVAFDVSTNRIPYRGVRGNGTATLEPDTDKTVLRALVERYLDGTDSDLARRLLDDERDEIRIRIEPRQVFSWDYTDRMQGTDDS